MSNEQTIPNTSTHDVITFDILVDGTAISNEYEVISIMVLKEVNCIPTARIEIADGEPSEETFKVSETDDFIPGKDIHIKIGRDSDNKTAFKGIITKHCINIKEHGRPSLVIECKDISVKLTVGRHNRYFEERQDSAVIEEIIGNYTGLTADIEATDLTHKELVQYHITDWDFLVSRADVNGKLVIVDDGKIQVKKPDTAQEPVLALQYGATLVSFHGEIDARTQFKKVKGQAWDYTNQDLFETETDKADYTEHGNIKGEDLADTIALEEWALRHSGQVVEEELQACVDANMLRSRMAKIRGRAKINVGYGEVKPGNMIKLGGVGDRFNGKAFVSGVRHEIGEGMWYTHLQFGLSQRWHTRSEKIEDMPAGGLAPAIRGLQIGKVVQLQDDPDGEDRVLVKLPTIDNQATGTWARMASLDAGENRGAFFRPEIDDEVIVGFINDDPRDAVVLGMLNSSAKPAPLVAEDLNHEKGFFTRSNMRVLFNDEVNKITIDTPAGNMIILDEESKSITLQDENDNKILMSPDGIEISSPKKIVIKAGTSMEIEAAASMESKATSIAMKADASLEAEGATTKMAAQGIAELTGSLVKIN